MYEKSIPRKNDETQICKTVQLSCDGAPTARTQSPFSCFRYIPSALSSLETPLQLTIRAYRRRTYALLRNHVILMFLMRCERPQISETPAAPALIYQYAAMLQPFRAGHVLLKDKANITHSAEPPSRKNSVQSSAINATTLIVHILFSIHTL